jgi:hypothetical protein
VGFGLLPLGKGWEISIGVQQGGYKYISQDGEAGIKENQADLGGWEELLECDHIKVVFTGGPMKPLAGLTSK